MIMSDSLDDLDHTSINETYCKKHKGLWYHECGCKPDDEYGLKDIQPKPDKMIRVYCFDWSEYTIDGKWVLYKGQKTGRFMIQDDFGNWNADRQSWLNRDRWEYLDENKN